MNKIQTKGEEKIQRKRRTRAAALPQLTASKISHKKSDYFLPASSTGSRTTIAERGQAASAARETETSKPTTRRTMAEPTG
jgi:hypothetical protein